MNVVLHYETFLFWVGYGGILATTWESFNSFPSSSIALHQEAALPKIEQSTLW